MRQRRDNGARHRGRKMWPHDRPQIGVAPLRGSRTFCGPIETATRRRVTPNSPGERAPCHWQQTSRAEKQGTEQNTAGSFQDAGACTGAVFRTAKHRAVAKRRRHGTLTPTTLVRFQPALPNADAPSGVSRKSASGNSCPLQTKERWVFTSILPSEGWFDSSLALLYGPLAQLVRAPGS